ncbi:CHAT domain-containing tetratricopeptide repeat protein [Streptomyces sp. NBS 14/10]|uniref:CHAT domain-containing protein n=1 Tax=Streptomyces sp. NBS 14/10 TaxID=1945643 RepID=UPI0015C6341D|nr:CHAT domain-containing tetratricopeptide repeat protein [Streptomyces sp. NBS 14/10]KAK1179710.1 CHAT domain-containing tetratricopeptide repeat protein [Streptomyces sp. NBS 14/10]
MTDREVALAALHHHLARADRNPAHIFDDAALEAARALMRITDPERDLAAAHALGWYHWQRSLVLPAGRDEEDQIAAVGHLVHVYQARPELASAALGRVVHQAGPTSLVATGLLLVMDRYANDLLASFGNSRREQLLDTVIVQFRAMLKVMPSHFPTRPSNLNGLGIALGFLFEDTKELNVAQEAVEVLREAVATAPKDHPERAISLGCLGLTLAKLYGCTQEMELLEEAVRMTRSAAALTPCGHPNRPQVLSTLGGVLRLWCARAGESSTAQEAVEALREAIATTPRDHPERCDRLNNLGAVLLRVSEHTREKGAAEEAARVLREAVAKTPHDNPERSDRLGNLGEALLRVSEHTGRAEGAEAAADVLREALSATDPDDPGRPRHLGNLGAALMRMAEHSGQREVWDDAVLVQREAVAITSPDDPDRPAYLHNLASALVRMAEGTVDTAVAEEAVRLHQEAVEMAPPNAPQRPMYLSGLGSSLVVLFRHTGKVEVLEEAVRIHRDIMEVTPHDHPDRPVRLSNLGSALQEMSDRSGQMAMLEEAVGVLREATSTVPHDHPARPHHLNQLGTALARLFQRTGQMALLEEAIDVLRQASETAPRQHLSHLNNLGSVLVNLFKCTDRMEALEEAVEVLRRAIEAAPDDHPTVLLSLGTALLRLFRRTGRMEVLEEGVGLLRTAAASVPDDHPTRPAHLNNLGSALLSLFERTGQTDELREAVDVLRAAAETEADNHPNRPMYLNNLGTALKNLCERTGQLEKLDEGIGFLREAAEPAHHDHPMRSTILVNLGTALESSFAQTRCTAVREEARDCYRRAADSATGITINRIEAYRRLARMATEPQDAQEGLQAMESAIDLLAALAPGTLIRTDREHQLGKASQLAGEAAAAALNAGRPDRAVELLERARGILAAETLATRSIEAARLREQHPRLADELDQLHNRLAVLDRPRSAPAEAPAVPSLEGARNENRRLAAERQEVHQAWQNLVDCVRGLPGFSDFLQAPSVDQLRRHAHDGPIVITIATRIRCDALILTDTPGTPVQVVPLTTLSLLATLDHVLRLREALRASTDPHLHPTARAEAQQDILATLGWLWDTVAEPVLTHLGHTSDPAPGEPWPRVWWCPVGVIASLPLHAAGHHAEGPDAPIGRRTVLDCVVSSYTTTVRALGHARSLQFDDTSDVATLIVPVSDAPGATRLGAGDEAAAITAVVSHAHLLAEPTRDTVLQGLPNYQIVHFSCHGYVDLDDLTNSHLLLTDYATRPLTVADIRDLNLTAALAYLSACDTSVTAPRLADESLHITGAFQLAGYRHVIGTLWPIDDRIASKVATDFYAYLTDNGAAQVQTDMTAHALNYAVTRLRTRYPNTPTLWAAYTHTGI